MPTPATTVVVAEATAAGDDDAMGAVGMIMLILVLLVLVGGLIAFYAVRQRGQEAAKDAELTRWEKNRRTAPGLDNPMYQVPSEGGGAVTLVQPYGVTATDPNVDLYAVVATAATDPNADLYSVPTEHGDDTGCAGDGLYSTRYSVPTDDGEGAGYVVVEPPTAELGEGHGYLVVHGAPIDNDQKA